MQSPRSKITIITSPPSKTVTLPPQGGGCLSPSVTKQYRIEERRTIFVSSDVHPSQWDEDSLNDVLESLPVRRSHSLVETQVITDELPNQSAPASLQNSPRLSVYGSRNKSGSKSASNLPPNRSSVGRPRILFYHKHDPHYGFTNFSPHSVYYKGKKYPTSEHLFQSFKFQEHRPNLAEHIRTCSERPSVAFSEARRFQPEVRRDWMKVNVQKMDETLWHKFTQHQNLKDELLATGDSDKDAFWGVGADGRGRNELGKALERLRTKLRDAS
ncbi:hypothetical protein BDQ17DRAFT_1358450 [Cyathus striatus]|nr:hypothetical protein BDQ17DRAFT_1358450 [Cyathus striatus]